MGWIATLEGREVGRKVGTLLGGNDGEEVGNPLGEVVADGIETLEGIAVGREVNFGEELG